MSRQDIRARVDAVLAQHGPYQGFGALCVGIAGAYAELAGDPITAANREFWSVAGNIFTAAQHELEPEGEAVAAFIALSQRIARCSDASEWQATKGIGERLFDTLDGGEELGLSDAWYGTDWHNVGQRLAALKHGMQFHRVPRRWQTSIADVVSDLMRATDNAWHHEGHQLPQPWAQCCCYVTYAIALRVIA
jgi:hypothetical protein